MLPLFLVLAALAALAAPQAVALGPDERAQVPVRATSALELRARGGRCRPELRVAVDGARVLTVRVGAVARTLTAVPSVAAGRRTLSVSSGHGGCRARVRVDRIRLRPLPAAPARWVPGPRPTWQWQLSGGLDASAPAEVLDVDLFETPRATVVALRASGRRLVCYTSLGTREAGRADAGALPAAVVGRRLAGWPGERWLDIRRLDVLAPWIERRLDACRAKGFDAVEADNVDAYANASGFALTAGDQLRFNRYLARAAHARGLAIALKNDLDQAAALEPSFDLAVVEQCFEYDECDRLAPFLAAGKPVLVAEYGLPVEAFCARARAAGVMAMRKRLDLDAWRQPCW